MHHITQEIEIAAPVDVTWRIVGDAGAIADWAPSLATSRLEGDLRFGTMPDGGATVEQITRHSDEDRSYTYTIVQAPLVLDGYESTIKVLESGAGSTVVWTCQFESDDTLRDAIEGMYRDGLASLAQYVEASV